MWERLLDATDATVHLDAEISWMKRRTESRHHNHSPVEIEHTKKNGKKNGQKNGKKKIETFDFVIMAAPMPSALDLLHRPTAEELELFSEHNYKTVRYDAGCLVDTGDVPENTFNLFCWADKQTDCHVTSRVSAHKGRTTVWIAVLWSVMALTEPSP
jgi:predicted NAD/FAD-binding protein